MMNAFKTIGIILSSLLVFVGCAQGPEGTAPGDCGDKADNDKNGFVDCEDEGCNLDDHCIELAVRAKVAEEEARKAKEAAAQEAAKKAAAEEAAGHFEFNGMWVMKSHNGENIAQAPAAAFCERAKFEGKDDWRLPTEAEAVAITRANKLKKEGFALWTSTMRAKKRGVIVGISSGAANELGVPYDGDCRALCVRDAD